MYDRMAHDQSQPTEESAGLRDLIEGRPALATGIGVGIIVVATLLAYVPAMRAGYIWDDNYYITANPLLRSFDGLARIWFDVFPNPAAYPLPQYYPMTHTSFWLEYRLWGLNPAGYHIVNVIVHTCNALLIWLLLRKLGVPGAFLAAAIFALHPVNVESVAWIAERKNVLCLLFFLSSLYVYLRYAGLIQGRDKPQSVPDDRKEGQIEWFTLPDDPQRLYGLAAVLFLCALFSKTIASSMPAVALLLIWWKRGLTRKDVPAALPLLAIGAAMGMLTAHMERVRVGVGARPQEWDYAPTLIGEFGARCMIAGKALWFYVGKLLFPYPLIFNYERWTIDPSALVQYVFIIAAVAVVVALALGRKRLGTGPLVAVLFYVGTLFPALGFVDVWPMRYSFVADHFVYISSIGLIALLAALISRLPTLEARAGVATVVVVLLFGTTYSHGHVYRNMRSLWEDTIRKTDEKSWFAMNNYGVWILDQSAISDPFERYEKAERWFAKVIKLKPDHAEARLNLAHIAERRAVLAQQELAWRERNPTSRPATMRSGATPSEYYEQAIRYYREAIDVQDNFVPAHVDLAQLLLSLGRTDEAIVHFNRAIELGEQLHQPHAPAHLALGLIDAKAGRLADARQHFIAVTEIDPYSVRGQVELGTVLLLEGHLPEGLAAWEEAMRLAPNDPALPNEFGAKMASSGEYLKASDYFRRALAIDPTSVEAMTNIGVTAALAGFPKEARDWFNRALQTDPKFVKAIENLKALDEGRLKPTTRASTQPSTRQASTLPAM
jgi:tetratricopeptide (TPR) repeat protein